MIRPTEAPVTLKFGATTAPYTSSNPHKGVDFSGRFDRNIYAPEGGRIEIVKRPNNGSCGNTIRLYKDNRRHTFCHVADSGFKVTNGQTVKQGQVLGIMGGTGTAVNSYATHLHWVLTVNGALVDPLKYVTQEEGNDMSNPTEAQVKAAFAILKMTPTAIQIKNYSSNHWTKLATALLQTARNSLVNESAKVTDAAKTISSLKAENAAIKTQLADCQSGSVLNKESVLKYIQDKLT